jgi:hypothetical protein
VTCTTYKTEQQTCYRDQCYTVCKPITEKKMVPVTCGEWQNVTETVPGAVMDQCQCDPGHWEYDPCTCCCMYHAGCCHVVKVQCPPTTCCRRVWVEKTINQEQCCTRYESEVKHCQVPYTVCRQVPCTSTHKEAYTVCNYTQEVCHKTVPYCVTTWHTEVCHKQVPCCSCSWEKQVCHKQIPYCTCHKVCETCYRTHTRCVPRTVQYTVTECVPRTVCRQVPCNTCQTCEKPACNACPTPAPCCH